MPPAARREAHFLLWSYCKLVQMFFRILAEEAAAAFDPIALFYRDEVSIFGKYLPEEFLRREFAHRILETEGRDAVRRWTGGKD